MLTGPSTLLTNQSAFYRHLMMASAGLTEALTTGQPSQGAICDVFVQSWQVILYVGRSMVFSTMFLFMYSISSLRENSTFLFKIFPFLLH